MKLKGICGSVSCSKIVSKFSPLCSLEAFYKFEDVNKHVTSVG